MSTTATYVRTARLIHCNPATDIGPAATKTQDHAEHVSLRGVREWPDPSVRRSFRARVDVGCASLWTVALPVRRYLSGLGPLLSPLRTRHLRRARARNSPRSAGSLTGSLMAATRLRCLPLLLYISLRLLAFLHHFRVASRCLAVRPTLLSEDRLCSVQLLSSQATPARTSSTLAILTKHPQVANETSVAITESLAHVLWRRTGLYHRLFSTYQRPMRALRSSIDLQG